VFLLINALTNFLHCTELTVILWVRSHYRLRSILQAMSEILILSVDDTLPTAVQS